MKHMKIFMAQVLACVCGLCLLGCAKQAALDTQWSAPVKFSQTEEAFGVTFFVHKWNNTLLVLRGTDQRGEYDCWTLGHDGVTRQKGRLTGFAGFSATPEFTDPTTNRLVFLSESHSDTQVKFTLRTVSLDENLRFMDVVNRELIVSPSLSSGEYVYGPVGGMGASDQSQYFVPYTIRTQLRHGNLVEDAESSPIGMFSSPDGGRSWHQNSVLKRQTWWANVGVLEHELYFLGWRQWGPGGDLWFSKQNVEHFSPASEVLTKSCAKEFPVMANTDDTIHLCWMDSRHEQSRPGFLFVGLLPLYHAERQENYQIFYRHVTSSDNRWGRETLISKNLLFAYRPSISAEGKKVVITWAGTRKAVDKGHDAYSPNDIYYATSEDNGQTWNEPVRVTDNIPRGITAGDPQVVLINNVFHLFYIEGKYQKQPSVSGLSFIKQPPWDIIYRQRPFPD